MTETRTEATGQRRPSGETQRDHSASPAADESLAEQLDALPAAQAKRLILRLKLWGEISLGEAQAQFARRPGLRAA